MQERDKRKRMKKWEKTCYLPNPSFPLLLLANYDSTRNYAHRSIFHSFLHTHTHTVKDSESGYPRTDMNRDEQ